MSFAAMLKKLRKDKGMTQEELAIALKISKSAISMYENGNRRPDKETFEVIADFFNVDINTLWGWEDAEIKTEEDEKNAEVIIFEGGSMFDLDKLPDGTKEDLTKVVQILRYEYSDDDFKLQVILDKEEILNLDALSLEKKKDLMKYIRFLLSDEK